MAAIVSAFHDEHKRAYGFNVPTEPVELVNLRVVAVQPITKPATRKSATSSESRTPVAKGRRQVYFADLSGWTDTGVYGPVRHGRGGHDWKAPPLSKRPTP